MQWILILIALATGVASPLQSGTNAALKSHLAQPLWATAVVYASGLAGVLMLLLITRQPLPTSAQATIVPWWAWMGGLISIGATIAGLTVAQKLGSGLLTSLGVSAGIIVSITLDHFALIGFKQHTASPMRLAGAALMVAGVILVSRF